MTLYLHIGTEKTGSSYLQSLAAQNREKLAEAGIHFPSAGKRDRQMLRGEVSAGNAQPLTDALQDENWSAVKQLLLKWTQEARDRNCQRLLLSNELLVLAMALPGRLEQLNRLTASISLQKIQTLLILRDPVEQGLSLYKHRAKSGSAPPIEDWPEFHYHYGEGLQHFLTSIKDISWMLTVRKYGKQALEQLFFHDWLGVVIDSEQVKQAVNPSLSLSELLLIRQLRQLDIWLPRFLYERLLSLPAGQKDPEPKLTHYYRAVLANHLAKFQATWELCNQYLPEGEKLDTLSSSNSVIQQAEKVLTFSPAQGEVITKFMQETASPAFQWKMRYRKYKHRLGVLKNKASRKKRKRHVIRKDALWS